MVGLDAGASSRCFRIWRRHSGMFRVFAQQLHPRFELYVSPVNVDPDGAGSADLRAAVV